MNDIIFQAKSPLGFTVTLRRRTWEDHESRRPELVGQVRNVELCIAEPHIVVTSGQGLSHHYRLGHGEGITANCYLHVLVRERGSEHVVASAWFTPVLEEGDILWFRMQ